MQSGGMQPGVPLDEVQAPTHEFFERARARLTQEVPPGLTDLNAEVRIRGDLDLEPELWEKAGVTHAGAQEPFRTGGVSRRAH
jgi:hypothetical protein